MKARLAALAALALPLSACGGKPAPTHDAAALVPAGAHAYVTIDRAQLRRAGDVLDALPLHDELLRQVRSLVPPASKAWAAAGPQVDVAVVARNEIAAMTQPPDPKLFDAQLPKRTLRARIRGWVVFSDSQAALDAIRNRKDALADDPAYTAAAKTLPLPGDAVARVYAARAGIDDVIEGQPLLGSFADARWVAAALSAQHHALKLETHAKRPAASTKDAPQASLIDEVPSGAVFAAATGGAGAPLPRAQLRDLSRAAGIDLAAIVAALDGPAVAYVRAAIPIPEVTIAARPSDPAAAVRTVGGVIARFARGQAKESLVPVDGGALLKTDLGALAVYHGRVRGEVVVTDSPTAPDELHGGSGQLVDSGTFKDAKDAAGMPDDPRSLLFLNLKDALPAVEALAQLANQKLPPEVVENVRPLRTLLAFTARDSARGIDESVVWSQSR